VLGDCHQFAGAVGRCKYSYSRVISECMKKKEEGRRYISIIDYDEFICGMGGGDEGDAHVCLLFSFSYVRVMNY
jgi:hypothetical protein